MTQHFDRVFKTISTMKYFMCESRLVLILGVLGCIKAEDFKCDEVTEHVNYNLLPRKPDCGKKNTELPSSTVGARILNGTQVERNEFPWLVYLDIKHRERPRGGSSTTPWHSVGSCGGSLINNRYVITAAHCIREEDDVAIQVIARLGEWKLDKRTDYQRYCCAEGRLVITVEAIIRHQSISRDDHNDICLMRLSQTVTFNEFVSPICLPLTCYWQGKDLQCYSVTVAGWGYIQVNPSVKESDIAEKLQMEVIDQTYCQKLHQRQHVIIPSQFCAGGEPWKSPCQGDSGDPVMLEESIRGYSTHYLVGIVSYEWPCDLQHFRSFLPPSVNTRVTSFIRWILDNIRP